MRAQHIYNDIRKYLFYRKLIKLQGVKMNYFTSDYFISLQGEVINFIWRNFSDCMGYKDFIKLVSSKDTSKEIILDKIDRDYLNEFIKHKELYAILDSEDEINEILEEDYIDYFMDCDLIALLDYFTGISFIELLTYVDIYKYNDEYYAIWDI